MRCTSGTRYDSTSYSINENVPVPPPPLDIVNEIILEAWLGFHPQLVGPSMNNLVLLFCHEYSVSGPHDLNS